MSGVQVVTAVAGNVVVVAGRRLNVCSPSDCTLLAQLSVARRDVFVCPNCMLIVEQAYEPASHKTPHAHDLPSMSMVLAGALRERMGRLEEIARPLSISLMPAGLAHADEFSSDGARLLSIHFDHASAQDFTTEDGALGDWRWIRWARR